MNETLTPDATDFPYDPQAFIETMAERLRGLDHADVADIVERGGLVTDWDLTSDGYRLWNLALLLSANDYTQIYKTHPDIEEILNDVTSQVFGNSKRHDHFGRLVVNMAVKQRGQQKKPAALEARSPMPLSDKRLQELWETASPFPQWETWQESYRDFLGKVRNLEDTELAKPENQKLVWSAEAITPLGPGGHVKIDGAFTDQEIVSAVVGLRSKAWPSDPAERSDAMREEGERILALVSPKHSSRRPQARLWRLFAALLPEDFHCVFNYQAQLHVTELLLHEGAWHSHVLIRDRLRKVLGPERDLAEHVRRSTFCWWLHENYDAIKRGEQPLRSTSTSENLKPITVWPYAKQYKGNFPVRRMVEAYRDVMKTALPGVPRSDLLDLLRADEEFKSLSISSLKILLSRLAVLGFLEQEGGLLRPTREGQELLENDVPDILVQRLLERIFPFAHLLRKLKGGSWTSGQLVAYQQELSPSWKQTMGPNSMLAWARSLELIERTPAGPYKLTEYGAAWEARLPGELPRPPESSGKLVVEEVEEEDQESSQPSESTSPVRPWPGLATLRVRFAEDLKARGFVLDETQLAALHHAWHCNPLKRFVILAGLSGTGKTALVQHYARLYCELVGVDVRKHLEVVAVSPDWKDPTGLLGYFNALHEVPSFQVEPALRLLLEAHRNPRLPYFLLLDEMNLARVEQYFAPFLSSMETGLPLALHGQDEPVNGVPPRLAWPENLFIAGTVNMDETTFPFSDKVLDRAFTLEFWDVNLDSFFESRQTARQPELEQVLREVHEPLRAVRRHFGYRTANEVLSFVEAAGPETSDEVKQKLLDQALFSKVLPRLRGEASPELQKTFEALLQVCERRALQRCGEKLKQMQSTLKSVGVTRFWA